MEGGVPFHILLDDHLASVQRLGPDVWSLLRAGPEHDLLRLHCPVLGHPDHVTEPFLRIEVAHGDVLASHIVEGLGNPDSFQSCSHGAGRAMSRTEAVRNLSLEAEVSRLEELGIVHAIRGQKDLEEAAGAYKDIDEVMANQTDLVKTVTALSPVAVIKG